METMNLYDDKKQKDIVNVTNNKLSNLDNIELKKVLNNNIKQCESLSRLKTFNKDIIVVYHKIRKNRTPKEYEGVYSVRSDKDNNRHLHSFTTFKSLIDNCIKERYNILNVNISFNYSFARGVQE